LTDPHDDTNAAARIAIETHSVFIVGLLTRTRTGLRLD